MYYCFFQRRLVIAVRIILAVSFLLFIVCKFIDYVLRLTVFITARCHGPVSVSVCLSVCLSQAGVLLKRQKVGSHKQHHTIPQGL